MEVNVFPPGLKLMQARSKWNIIINYNGTDGSEARTECPTLHEHM
jgi:hypothetical protein